MKSKTPAVAVCAAALVTTLAPSADAYCRTTTVAAPPDHDPNGGCFDQGKPLFWKNACVGFSVQQAAGKQVSSTDLASLLGKAFSAWTSASCTGGGRPSLEVRQLASSTVRDVGYNSGAPNVNIVLMRDDAWDHGDTEQSLALTTVVYNPDTGEIYDADIEINTGKKTFALTDPVAPSGTDLQAILTHQVGHFLGFAHSPEPKSTMFATYAEGSTDGRTLDPDDVAAVCDVYAPGGGRKAASGSIQAATCDPTPRGGLEVTPKATDDGCATTPGGASSTTAAFAVTAAALLLARRRAGTRARKRPMLTLVGRRSRGGG